MKKLICVSMLAVFFVLLINNEKIRSQNYKKRIVALIEDGGTLTPPDFWRLSSKSDDSNDIFRLAKRGQVLNYQFLFKEKRCQALTFDTLP